MSGNKTQKVTTQLDRITLQKIAALAAHWGLSPVRHISEVIKRETEIVFDQELSGDQSLQETDQQGVTPRE